MGPPGNFRCACHDSESRATIAHQLPATLPADTTNVCILFAFPPAERDPPRVFFYKE